MRLTYESLLVLHQLLDGDSHGLALMRSCGLGSGTVYPVLSRLESEGWASSRAEDGDPVGKQRALRRVYSLTDVGRREAVAALNRLSLV